MNDPKFTRLKVLGRSSYGSIGHLPTSRMDINHQRYETGKVSGVDFGLSAGQSKILTEKVRDKYDQVFVHEKLDGSNLGVAKVDGVLHPITRAGYLAKGSKYVQHQWFHDWVMANQNRFQFLSEGERVCGEWLAQAHGTRYSLPRGPFIIFDIINEKNERALQEEFEKRTADYLPRATLLSVGPTSIKTGLSILGERGYDGAIDPPEGLVYRVERKGRVDFLGKYVRPEKEDGSYFPKEDGDPEIYNWTPERGNIFGDVK